MGQIMICYFEGTLQIWW